MDLAEIVSTIDGLKAELDQLRPLDETRLRRLEQKLRFDWNFHSNRMEGNTLSESETRSFLLTGITAHGKPFRDYLEMKGHNDALQRLYRIVRSDLRITESLIQDFHRLILVEPFTDDRTEIRPGEWKQRPNYLYSTTSERIDFAPPADVPRLMNELVNWLNNHLDPPKRKRDRYDLHPLLIVAGFHLRFTDIHPFGDGNGRMARILTNLILMICGYVPVIIREEDRQGYFAALNASTPAQPTVFAEFIGLRLIASLRLTLHVARGGEIVDLPAMDAALEQLNRRLRPDAEQE